MLASYFSMFTFLLLILLFGLLTTLVSAKLGPQRPNETKLSTYECGMEPIGPNDFYFNVNFYKIAMLFILFDVEVVFFFPWALLAKKLQLFGLIEIIIFIVILGIGFIYAYKRGALEWD